MSVIVMGMEMPKSLGLSVTIYSDGRVVEYYGYGKKRVVGTAIALPEKHGRLIDADAYIEMMQKECDESATLDGVILKVCRGGVKAMPTIVEAEGD